MEETRNVSISDPVEECPNVWRPTAGQRNVGTAAAVAAAKQQVTARLTVAPAIFVTRDGVMMNTLVIGLDVWNKKDVMK